MAHHDQSTPTRTRPALDTKTFPFEQLPAELREAVYEEVLVAGTIRIRLLMTTREPENNYSSKVVITGRDASTQQRQLEPAILRTSREIHNEALPVLYSMNTFSFTSITALRQFTRDSKPGIALLRYVAIATTGRFAFWEPMNQLLRAENLRSLIISIGPDDVKERGWSDVVLEVTDFIVRKAAPTARRKELDRISFVSTGSWLSSGNPSFRSCSSDEAPGQVRARIEKRLRLTGSLPT